MIDGEWVLGGFGVVRQARIKVDAGKRAAVYHVMSRTVNGERLLDDVAKEVLRKQLWQVAEYCGVEVLTYALMSNHFHVLLRVPHRNQVSDAVLLRRYAVLYPKPTRYQTAQLDVITGQLRKNGPEAVKWRARQLALMGDVSQFMKLLKQRFSVWFNRSHNRFGTLWSERFKSVLVEGKGRALKTMAAYIDLNPVRAGLVDDPKDYRFCGYAEAVAGAKRAVPGVIAIMGGTRGRALAAYRELLFGKGSHPASNRGCLSAAEFQRVVKNKGQLPMASVLRCRIRHFSDGAVLGSQAFVQEHLVRYQINTGRRERTRPRHLPHIADWGDLTTLRGLRRQALG
ncbi:transposase [Synoicihabitans lomoniglobus]|uniref:Transposase n=1 Tax=Synoicihabitans lomoniglobus TaxID=2909285 RepID=A0AAE9ZVJ3_9BACT|nr:transposase [Opitutaceae bacterium LMO-M01]WED63248.1 transposase [Opitutaceae bacterium LMO-M01]